jgi:hypothetical protein
MPGDAALAMAARRTPSRKLEVVQEKPMKAGFSSVTISRIRSSASGLAKQSTILVGMPRLFR